jgi:hypothetical protein
MILSDQKHVFVTNVFVLFYSTGIQIFSNRVNYIGMKRELECALFKRYFALIGGTTGRWL